MPAFAGPATRLSLVMAHGHRSFGALTASSPRSRDRLPQLCAIQRVDERAGLGGRPPLPPDSASSSSGSRRTWAGGRDEQPARPGMSPAQESHRSATFEPRRASVNVTRKAAPLFSPTSFPQLSQTRTVLRATKILLDETVETEVKQKTPAACGSARFRCLSRVTPCLIRPGSDSSSEIGSIAASARLRRRAQIRCPKNAATMSTAITIAAYKPYSVMALIAACPK